MDIATARCCARGSLEGQVRITLQKDLEMEIFVERFFFFIFLSSRERERGDAGLLAGNETFFFVGVAAAAGPSPWRRCVDQHNKQRRSLSHSGCLRICFLMFGSFLFYYFSSCFSSVPS